MNGAEQLDALLKGFGADAGVELALDNGVCGVELADGVRAVVALSPDGGAVWLYAQVAEVKPDQKAHLLEAALRRNFFGDGMGGAWLALSDDARFLMLCASRSLEGFDNVAFGNLFQNFIALALDVAAALDAKTPQSAVGGVPGQDPPPPAGGFA